MKFDKTQLAGLSLIISLWMFYLFFPNQMSAVQYMIQQATFLVSLRIALRLVWTIDGVKRLFRRTLERTLKNLRF